MTAAAQDRLDRRLAAKRAAGRAPVARSHVLSEGETVEGTVVRLPMWSVEAGTRLFLQTDTETISIPATAGKGHTVLEQRLADECVMIGDDISITYRGKRRTADGAREYRDYHLEVCRRGL